MKHDIVSKVTTYHLQNIFFFTFSKRITQNNQKASL